MQKLVWPHPLVMIYPKWSMPMDATTILVYVGIVAIVGIGCLWAAVASTNHQSPSPSSSKLYQRGPFAALLFYGWTLFPVLGLLDYGYMNYSFVADRYQYLASIGPTVLIVMAGLGTCPSRTLRNILGIMGLAILVFMTRQQVDHYQNDETFFLQVTRYNPNASIGYLILGNEYLRQNRLDEAISMYEQALAVQPEKEMDVLMNYGIALNQLERNQESVAVLERYLELETDTSNYKIWNALGNAHSGLKHHDRAILYFRRALDQNPDYASCWYNLGNEYLRSGRIDESINAYERTIQLDPQHIKAYINMASALMASNQNQRAVHVLERALKLHPQNSLVLQKLQEGRTLLHNP
jgi:tetratricopeptide (TPR) repeat protein